MSSLEAISGFKLKIDIMQNITKDCTHLANSGKTIILCWRPSPSHVNIRGNERADTAAKSAPSLPVTNMKLPARELLSCVSNFCLDEWQEIWECCEGNKLHSIYPTVGILKDSKNMSRYDSVTMLKSDSYRTGTAESPMCECGQDKESVPHILLHCGRFVEARYEMEVAIEDIYTYAKSNSSGLDSYLYYISTG